MIQPERIWNDPSLSSIEKLVLAVLTHNSRDGEAAMTNEQIARQASVCVRSVQNAMRRLREKRLVAIVRPPRPTSVTTTFAAGAAA